MKPHRSALASPSNLLPLSDDPGADPRIDAFSAWLRASDRLDTPRATRLARELRSLGVSVCLVARPPNRAGGGY